MKAICLLQPWATLMAIGAKRIETRSWATAYRGSLVIVASRKWTREQEDLLIRFCASIPHGSQLGNECEHLPGSARRRGYLALPLGKALCQIELVDCVRIKPEGIMSIHNADPLRYNDEEEFGDFSDGRYAWLTSWTHRFANPFDVRGRLGLFGIDDELVRAAG